MRLGKQAVDGDTAIVALPLVLPPILLAIATYFDLLGIEPAFLRAWLRSWLASEVCRIIFFISMPAGDSRR
mgnify:CR=1 FL=1